MGLKETAFTRNLLPAARIFLLHIFENPACIAAFTVGPLRTLIAQKRDANIRTRRQFGA